MGSISRGDGNLEPVIRFWRKRHSLQASEDWSPRELDSRERQTVERLWSMLYPVTVQAVDENHDDAFLCQLFVFDTDKGGVLAGDDNATNRIRAGVRRGLDISVTHGGALSENVKRGVSSVLSERASSLRSQLQTEDPAQFLSLLLTTASLDMAAGTLRQLSQEQRRELLTLVARYKGKDPLITMSGFVSDAEDRLEWIARYTNFLNDANSFEQFQIEHGRHADALVFAVGGKLGPPQRDKDGEPLNLFGPMHVKMTKLLASEQTKHGIHGAAEQGSFSNIARSLNTDHRRVARWWGQRHRLSDPWVTPEGNIKVIATPNDLKEMVRMVHGDRRGRKRDSP